jgi:hypothetical protein
MGGRGSAGRSTQPHPTPAGNDTPISDRIRRVYQELAARPGQAVHLADIRARLDSITRTDLDRALLDLDERRTIQLEPDPDRARLTVQRRDAAIDLAGRKLHLLRFRQPPP